MGRDEWIAAFTSELATEGPSPEQSKALLELAAVAAHASERTAAPLACWIAGRTGRPVEELLAVAERIGGA